MTRMSADQRVGAGAAGRRCARAASRRCETIERYLRVDRLRRSRSASLDRRDGERYGAMLRRGAAEAKGERRSSSSIPICRIRSSAIGDAVAMIESGATDVVFATTTSDDRAAMRCFARCS